MDIETIRTYCLHLKGVGESLPFDDQTLVFKVGGKMFALLSLDDEPAINVKCDPERAIELRERYPEVKPGYHMNKQHWNTIALNGNLERKEIFAMIDDSYKLIVASLPKKLREAEGL